MEIAIIGGGWAGLSAGIELCQKARVTLFESARQLGGRARRVEFSVSGETLCLDNGQHMLIGAYSQTLRLIRKSGGNSELLLKRQPLEINYPGVPFHLKLAKTPSPLNLVLGLLLAKGCTFTEKLAMVKFMSFLQSKDFVLGEEISVAQLLDQHHQRGNILQFLWEPLCISALNTSPKNASAQVFANVLRDSLAGKREATDFLLPTSDLGALFPDNARGFIERHDGQVFLSERIDSLENLPVIGEKKFDQIVLATDPYNAARLLATLPQTAAVADTLSQYTYETIGTVYLAYPPSIRLPHPMLGIGRTNSTEEFLGQWVFDLGQLRGISGLMAFSLSTGDWEAYDNSTLADKLHRELELTLGTQLPTILWHKTIREKRATFTCVPALTRPPMQLSPNNLWLAGDYAYKDYPATLEGAVRSGINVANAILHGQNCSL